MNVAVSALFCLFSALTEVYSVPPDICFQQFKWQDCGMPPKAVIYYYKSGSRCEVGFWRGCLPNPNMFADEYECVQTCIYSVRAKPYEYHQFQMENVIESDEAVTEDNSEIKATTVNAATGADDQGTDVTTAENETGEHASGSDDVTEAPDSEGAHETGADNSGQPADDASKDGSGASKDNEHTEAAGENTTAGGEPNQDNADSEKKDEERKL